MKHLLRELPTQLQVSVEAHLTRFRETAAAELQLWLDQKLADGAFAGQLYRVWSGSEFVASNCIRYPEVFRHLVDSGDLNISYNDTTVLTRCLDAVEPEASNKPEREATLHTQLRHFRRYEMLRIVWRDLTLRVPSGDNEAANMIETTCDMSRLADAVIQVTSAKLQCWLSETWGEPVGALSGLKQHLLVLAMGKLGADELNVSSDIDLIFAYPEVGETEGAGKALGNQEFFIKLAQKLIQALDNQTADGQVFRVDMRLRPYGGSGALVLSFDALEEYYQTQGRDWERYAMIKSRVIETDQVDGAQAQAQVQIKIKTQSDTHNDAQALTQILRAFTYRRFTDFSAIQSLRDMKTMINLEVQRRGLSNNIKLGHGGIREIEFIAQAFQLIRGGRDRRFQARRLQAILLLLDTEAMLPNQGGRHLWAAYVFLRNLEHVLQGWRDQQTQELPTFSQDTELDCLRIATMMGFAHWQEFSEQLDRHREVVGELFQELVAETEEEQAGGSSGDVARGSVQDPARNASVAAWSEASGSDLQALLENLGYDDGQAAGQGLESLRDSRKIQAMVTDARQRLDKLMPEVIAACALADNATETLARVSTLVESVARRSAYLVLLIENPLALKQLVALCAASPWISQSLARHPVLLDELLDARTLFAPPDRQQMGDELRQQLLRIPEDDLEAQMDALRYFRLAHGLRVSACEVMEVTPLMKVSDYLTCLAEVILEEVVALAWQQMTVKHGYPGLAEESAGITPVKVTGEELAQQSTGPAGFLVLGYGKLGGIELGHGSDLDLVFLHNADARLVTTGERSIDNETFFVRLGQRVIHLLNTVTSAGILYEVDMRLRPSGNSGLLVSSLEAFAKYQRESAWTWEHQALVRARPVAGDVELAAEFNQLRHEVLIQARDIDVLTQDVKEMRQKMAEHLGLDATEKQAGQFHLKQDSGGIVDIEFMVQFSVLAQAHSFPQLTRWSDNIRILDLLSECELMTAEESRHLTDAYIAYRSAGHRLQLQQAPSVVAAAPFEDHRASVLALWQKLFGRSA